MGIKYDRIGHWYSARRRRWLNRAAHGSELDEFKAAIAIHGEEM